MCEPSPYPKNDAAESDAITLFRSVIDTNRLKLDIKERDKHPNIDGAVELVDSRSIPQGKLDVQIRKIPDGARSYSCPTSLLAYSQSSSSPVLLIACDTEEQRVMWRHIYAGMPEFKENQKTFTIKFSAEDEIDTSGRYLDRWQAIASDYNQRIVKFPEFEERVANELEIEGVSPDDFAYFQEYVGELNALLDRDFQIIKERILPRAWKIGVGIAETSDEIVQYKHYRLELGTKQPLVTRIKSPSIFENDSYDPSVLESNWSTRSAMIPPKQQALEFLQRPIEIAMKKYKFVIHGLELAQNTLVQFANLYPRCLGLSRKDEYTLTELRKAFYENLPKACHRYLPLPKDPSRVHIGHIDLDRMEPSLNRFPDLGLDYLPALSSYEFRSIFIPIHVFEDALSFASSANLEVIRNPWEPTDERCFPWTWGYSDKERMRKNIRALLEKLIINYSQFVTGNQLALVQSPYRAPDISIIYRFEEREGEGFMSCPILHEYHINNADMSLPKQVVLVGEDAENDPVDLKNRYLILNGKSWKLDYAGWSLADWPFQKFPYLRGVYKLLATDLSSAYGYRVHVQ
ncbi:hypothetical protein P4C99_21510 [Pontiellaceae bacterium B1224]|nr:hypothetical protein [Pontiellaceae bacterium B1224]